MKKNLIMLFAMLACSITLLGQQVQVTGKVLSGTDNTALPGVNVIESGTTNGAVTDIDGNFSLSVTAGASLTFSSIGYVTQELALGDRTVMNVTLEEDVLKLDEVVVTGYGVQRKSDLTAAIASVSTDELPDAASLSINNMLQGRVSGVTITPMNGNPGAGVSVKIRGTSSINNSEPLYIVDGVQIRNQLGTSYNALSVINPNDIERIEILKDAASAAIYGSSGANGVVLITTKKGQTGKAKVDFSTHLGFATTPKKLDVMKADDYVDLLMTMQQAANPNSPINEVVGPTVLDEGYSRVDRTYWQDEVFQTAPIYNADLSVSGGTPNANYLASFGYANQEGIVIGTDYTRYTSRIATEFKIGKRIRIGQNFNMAFTDQTDSRAGIDGGLRMAPYVPVYDDSNWWGYGNNNNVNDNNNADNPVTTVAYSANLGKRFSFIGNIFGEVEIIDGLKYYATLSMNYGNSFTQFYEKEHVNSNEQLPTRYSESFGYGLNPRFEQTLTYAKTIGKNDFTVLAGMSADRGAFGNGVSLNGAEYPNENLWNLTLADESMISNAWVTASASLSYFGRLNYSYDNKYLLTAIIRRDGSDKFSENYRWGTFPSVSAAWKLHNESFISNSLPGVSTLKLRAGWGMVGNDAIGQFQYSSFIHSIGMSYPVGGSNLLTGATIKALSSPDIRWEEATTMNIGLDMGFLNNKLTATVDWFTKETADILLEVPTSPSMGLGLDGGLDGGSRVENAATAVNTGIEALLRYMNYDNEFKYGITATFSYINNEVTGLGEGGAITGPAYNGQAAMTLTDIGHPIGSFYGYNVDKIYSTQAEIDADNAAALAASGGEVAYYQSDLTAPGDIRFKDNDENGYITDEDREYIGCPIPKYSFGIVLDAEYKGFDFSMNLSGVAGVDIYSAYYTWSVLGMRVTGNHLESAADYWTDTNTDAEFPRPISNDPNNNLRTSDRYIYNGAFLKMRNLSIGYTLPFQTVQKAGISRLRVYVAAQNLLTISNYIGYDPEISSYAPENMTNGYNLGRGIDALFTPIPRTYLIGLQVTF